MVKGFPTSQYLPPAASKAASDRSSPNASSFIKSVSDSLIVLSLPLDGTTPPCQRRAGLLASGVRQSTETLLCCRADGEPHRPLSLTYEFARFIRRLKDLPQVRFHDLRHSHATQLLASGVHPKIASERLGHASIGITLDLYSHVTAAMQGEAATKLDSAMQAAKSRLASQK